VPLSERALVLRSPRPRFHVDPAQLEELAAAHGNNKYEIARGLGCSAPTLWNKLRAECALREAFARGLERAGVPGKPPPASEAEDRRAVFAAILGGAETLTAIQRETGLTRRSITAALYTLEREQRAIKSRQNAQSITRYEATVEELQESPAPAPKRVLTAEDDAGKVTEAIAAGQRTVSEIMAYTGLANRDLRRALKQLEDELLVRVRVGRGMLQHFYLASEEMPQL
jgi:predicted Rossmann fold nucleotide-binding protein DprA/Smf involved in DNA uptake